MNKEVKSEVRSQKSEVRSQKSDVRSQKLVRLWRIKSQKSVLCLLFSVLCICCLPKANAADGKENWRLGMQAYSFKEFTFYEAVDKTKALGLGYIEVYPGHRLSKEQPDIKTDHNMSSQTKKQVLQKLREAGVKLTNYGVVKLPNNEAECRKVFNFAREMGIETIVSEPPEDALDLIDRLCEEYKINVAIHNHPKPKHYWDPDTVLKACRGRSKRIGACADTGHWMRSGINPVEALKKLEGRIISLHIKDLNEFGNRAAHDVIWGTGLGDIKAVLAELDRQNFKGVFSIEYEHNWLNSMPEIAESVSYFERTAAELGQTDWQWIFNGRDLTGWDGEPRFWSVKDGAIRGQTTLTKPALSNTFLVWRGGELKDFELRLKFRIRNGNSGVQYRSKEFDKWRISGYQAEVVNDPGKVGFLHHEKGRGRLVNVGDMMVIDEQGKKHVVGRVADKDELIKAGYYKEKDWNEYRIIAAGNHLLHYLNGYPTMELVDNDRVTDPDDPKDRKGAARQGILALQLHAGLPMLIEFKDIRIRELKSKYGDAVVLFNGKDLNDWVVKGSKEESKWVVGTAKMSSENPKLLVAKKGECEMINLAAQHRDSIDIYSKAKFGDCRVELEVMVPEGANSGIYLMGAYEIQVLDSWERVKMGGGDMGAVYGASPPRINACKRPGEWQKYVIDFIAPKFDASGKKIRNAKFIKVELNGQVLHENLVLEGLTGGSLTGKEAPTGPLMFQGNHGPVAYRNIIIKPLVE
jgi:sugar phosphate isomerase/epimerase